MNPSYDLTGITHITNDSRTVTKGALFAALPGAKTQGRTFIADAIERGAVAILAAPDTLLPKGVRLIPSDDPGRDFALISAQFYGWAQPDIVVAVTGTNGKTSTVHFTRQLWEAKGFHAQSLGTLEGAMTTPDPVALHARLAAMYKEGITHLAMEASSHGLDQRRLDGVRLSGAAFTNLTRDHLDYHKDMAAYREAKQRLFADLLPPQSLAVINADNPEGISFIRVAPGRVVTYGKALGADIRALTLTPLPHGQRMEALIFGEHRDVTLPLIGAFQASNILCALALACDGRKEEALALFGALGRLRPVPGRMEQVADAPIYVDYAHTPDGLKTALTALRPHCEGRIICVFGCGGERDAGKRPMMGHIAAHLADLVIVTDDNPRGEDSGDIRKAILAAAPEAMEIGDRAKAIEKGISLLQGGDILLIAGKGHEIGQTILGITYPFHDATCVQDILKETSHDY